MEQIAASAYLRHSDIERFWSKVEKSNECWTWTAGKDRHGYGQFHIRRKNWRAHRVSFLIQKGYLPEGMFLDHICHNRACVNPEHLRPVTNKQNGENRAGLDRNNSSGVRGVYWNKQDKKWKATVYNNLKPVHVGCFSSIEEAETAVIEMRNKLFTHNDLDREHA